MAGARPVSIAGDMSTTLENAESRSVLAALERQRRLSSMAAEGFRATLAGLDAVNVQVEPLNADAEADGLTRSGLQSEVEGALREAGLAVLTPTELFASAVGTPFLHLDVMTIRLDGHYAYSVRLELWQAVSLVRDTRIRALALTWSGSQLVGTVAAANLGELRATVRAAASEFAGDCLAASGRT